MNLIKAAAFALLSLLFVAPVAQSQTTGDLEFTTVHRPPFSILEDTGQSGFSIDLMREIATRLDVEINFTQADDFTMMLESVRSGQTDGAVANISITAARESEMDFSLPIFASGLQILLPEEESTFQQIGVLMTREILLLGLLALGLLFGGGMLMWVFERRHQPYFDRPAGDAMFPSFWWALNLVVNGGFEERMPMSRLGRVFAVLLVISSLFVVSVFVATITAAVTVDALQSNVQSISDLEHRRVATVEGSTSADFLGSLQVGYEAFDDPQGMLKAFDEGSVDAVVFDGPILAYYANGAGAGKSRLIDRVYRPEDYGIALPSDSSLREPINRALLELLEDGTYDAILQKWFGSNFRRN
ncbi:transporter substrate-binding domain-containing protein [Shimia thalassica]|uniref:transporter substrate-binding domain-containing protein n=1 Tax=Shimia thalassica TaxID=1715693 RepID=UPI0026E42E7B|nr:transporter substrate-binding domain-containing protein [Shimia thalassica]MDO6485434.1 transporter substrate-binding domain-containing protein [Shimia thalassica]